MTTAQIAAHLEQIAQRLNEAAPHIANEPPAFFDAEAIAFRLTTLANELKENHE